MKEGDAGKMAGGGHNVYSVIHRKAAPSSSSSSFTITSEYLHINDSPRGCRGRNAAGTERQMTNEDEVS